MRINLMFPVLLILTLQTYTAHALDNNTRQLLTGKWQWENSDQICQSNDISTISFSADGKKMYLSATTQSFANSDAEYKTHTYNMVDVNTAKLRTFIEGETRVDNHGDVIMWDIKIISENEFCWHRSDWDAQACTRSLLKC